MKNFLRQNGLVLVAIAGLLSLLIGIGSAVLGGSSDPVANVVNSITAPLRKGVSSVLDMGEGVFGYVFKYGEIEQEIADLRAQVADLQEQVIAGQDANRENDQLRKLLELKERRRDFTFESARVTNRSTSNWESTFTLSKGSKHGLALGDCVVTETGVLAGIITELGTNWATVSTVINLDIELGGVISRTLSAGILEGDFSLMGEGQLKMSYLPNEAALVNGDRVVTSGKGDVYPSGLAVGQVDGVFSDPSGQSRYAVIVPDADLDNLIEVFVITDFDIVE